MSTNLNPFNKNFPITERKILFEKKTNAIEYTLLQEPDGKLKLLILYKQFQKPRILDLPCEKISEKKYRCQNFFIDLQNKNISADIKVSDAIKESPLIDSIISEIKASFLKTVVVGVITGVSIYFITKLIENLAEKTVEEIL